MVVAAHAFQAAHRYPARPARARDRRDQAGADLRLGQDGRRGAGAGAGRSAAPRSFRPAGRRRSCARRGSQSSMSAPSPALPEMMDGRVKTLHPAIHGGLLALRDDPAHQAAMAAHGIGAIDCLVVNLYPFEATVAAGASAGEAIENIDIGGPAMIRAAAKNASWVTVVTDPADYAAVAAAAASGGEPARAAREGLRRRPSPARPPMTRPSPRGTRRRSARTFRSGSSSPRRCREKLRYGENPHQAAALYLDRRGASRASPRRGRCRASRSPTTTSTTPTRPSS